MTEQEAYVAFNLAERVGSVTVEKLVSRYGSVAAAWENFPKKVARNGGEIDWQLEFSIAAKYHVTILTPADADYPEILRKTQGHPLVLYVMGDVAALSKAAIAIVGTRRATAYGRDQANRFGYELAGNGWCIVSGLALGVDAEAHRGALDAGGVTVAVLGSALDRLYPEENRELAREIVRKGGAVVSEFPFGREPDNQTFPQRNHVVAALASGVLAVEAPSKSGTLITVGFATTLGRTCMAVPGRVDSPSSAGCLKLIRDGVTLVRCAADVQEAMSNLLPPSGRKVEKEDTALSNPVAKKSPIVVEPPKFSLEESMIMREVDAAGVSMDHLVGCTGLSESKVATLCMTLRLKGRLRYLPGNRVALPRQP